MPIDRDGEGPPLRRDDSKSKPVGRDELRATPFTDDVFNDDYYGRRPRASGGRSVSLVVGVVLGLAIVGGVGYYAFNHGGMSLATGEPQLVKADPAPYKIKPDDPGGMQVDNQDKLVYDRVAKGRAPNRVENLLPPAEEPKAPPQKPKAEEAAAPDVVPPAAVPPSDTKALQAMVKSATEEPKPAAPAASTPPAAPPSPPTQVATAAPTAPPPAPAPKETPKEAPKEDPLVAAVAAATGKPEPASPPAKPAAPAEPAPVQTASAVAPATTAAPMPGAFQIQLASAPSEDAANSEWKRISNRHKDLLGTLTPAITKADLGEKGVFFRLRAGPLADKAAADALCAALAAEKTGCIVLKP